MGNDHTAWMPVYWRDVLAETAHLSAAEFGAYCALVAAHWNSRGPLPCDPEKLRRLARMDREEWRDAETTLVALFVAENGQWLHRGVIDALAKSEARYRVRSEQGRRGGLARAKSGSSPASANNEGPLDNSVSSGPTKVQPPSITVSSRAQSRLEQAKPEAQAHESPKGDSTGAPSAPNPIDDLELPAFLDRRPKNAARLPTDWTPGESGHAFAATLGIDRTTSENVAAQFRDHWIAKPGSDGLKTDWDATWRNWLRKHIDFHGSGPWPTDGGRRPQGDGQGRGSVVAAVRALMPPP